MSWLKQTLKNSILWWLAFSLTVLLSFITYALVINYQDWTGDVSSWQSLTSTLWNKMQDNQTYLKQEVDYLWTTTWFRNLIINWAFRVNQRAATSKTATANAYNYDRWYYDGTNLIQFIEDKNVVKSWTYTLSWEGAANWYVDWSPVSNWWQVSLTANTQVEVKFDSSDVNYVQLEYGTRKTPFEIRPYGMELELSQRYYQEYYIKRYFGTSTLWPKWLYSEDINFNIMRISPVIDTTSIINGFYVDNFEVLAINEYRAILQATANDNYNTLWAGTLYLEAEIYP